MSPSPVLLHLTHRLPYPPDKGDRIRTYHTLKYLAGRARVHLAALADEPVPAGAEEELRKLCERVAVIPLTRWRRRGNMLLALLYGRPITVGAFHSRALIRLIARWCRDTAYDACLASSSGMVQYLRKQPLRRVPAVVDLVDVDSRKWLDYADASRPPLRWLYRLEARRLRRTEKEIPSWARAVTLTTPAEVAIYESFAGPGSARVVANGVDLDYFRPLPLRIADCGLRIDKSSNPQSAIRNPQSEDPQSEGPSCVFVGALDYRPNVEGIVWFCEEMWPSIKERRPDGRLFIVGRNPIGAVRRLASVPGVEVVGTVPDVRPRVGRADVVVVPLRIARGVQNKVLEALAMSRAVVASPASLAGLGTVPGKHLLSAATPEEWVTTILSLFDDPVRRERLGAAGRAYVEEHHCWESCLAPLANMLLQPEGLP